MFVCFIVHYSTVCLASAMTTSIWRILQVLIPPAGARLLMASDGLWDFFSGSRACKIVRKARLEKAPARLFRALMFQTDGLLLDDTTIMIVDILPKGTVEFRDAVKEAKKATRQGLVSKVRRAINSLFKDDSSRTLELYSDMDALDAFPMLNSQGFSIFNSCRSKTGNPRSPQVESYKNSCLDNNVCHCICFAAASFRAVD